MNTIEIKNLNYKYDNSIIFNNLNLKIEDGSITCVAGNNNSGKTTLIKLISGLLPSNNSITIGYSYLNSDRINDHSKNIGVMFGDKLDFFLFEDVYKEMAFPLENLNIEPSLIEKKILEITKYFEVNKLLDKRTSDLTNNEKQIVLLIISLLHNPKTLLLDNPFSMMDKETKRKIKDKLFKYIKKNNITTLLATINLEDTVDADYLYIINNGNVVIEGKPLTVLKEDTIIKKIGLSLPFMVDLSLKLEFYELLDDIELDMNRMVDILWK